MSKPTVNDYPIEDCAEKANAIIDTATRPTRVYQKWTCQHCGARQTMEVPNIFYRSGFCEECHGTTLITRCNYMLVIGKDIPS